MNVAALVAHKDHATLLAAAALARRALPALHWVVGGEGPSCAATRARFGRARARATGSTCSGTSPSPSACSPRPICFVMSSREEGLGTSVLDAMALGVPVASTTAGGLPEMLADGAGLLVPPGDPTALADAVARILTDPTLRARARRPSAHRRRSGASPRGRMAEGVLTGVSFVRLISIDGS